MGIDPFENVPPDPEPTATNAPDPKRTRPLDDRGRSPTTSPVKHGNPTWGSNKGNSPHF